MNGTRVECMGRPIHSTTYLSQGTEPDSDDPFDDHREFSCTIRISSRVCGVSRMIVEKKVVGLDNYVETRII